MPTRIFVRTIVVVLSICLIAYLADLFLNDYLEVAVDRRLIAGLMLVIGAGYLGKSMRALKQAIDEQKGS